MSLDGVIYLVKLIEIPLDEIVLSKGRVIWPKTVDGQPMPPVDGVMILYDVTTRNSVSEFPGLLGTYIPSRLRLRPMLCFDRG